MIRRVTVDFNYAGHADGIALQNEVMDWVRKMPASFEKIMDEINDSDEIVTVNELELEIYASGINWKNEASSQILTKLKEKLQSIKAGQSAQGKFILNKSKQNIEANLDKLKEPDEIVSGNESELQMNSGDNTESQISKQLKVKIEKQSAQDAFTQKNTQRSFEENFIFFLKQGLLPWYVSDAAKVNWSADLQNCFAQDNESFSERLIELIASSFLSKERFMNSIPFHWAERIFAHQEMRLEDSIGKSAEYIRVCLKSATSELTYDNQRSLYSLYLDIISGREDEKTLNKKMITSFKEVAITNPGIADLLNGELFSSENFIDVQNSEDRFAMQVVQNQERQFDIQMIKQNEIILPEESIFISNAGLVLVSAFLPALFRNLDLVNDDVLNNELLAVCLVQYLATGNQNMQEFDLILPKILCGLPVEKPIDCNLFYMSEVLKKEVSEMLRSIIEHWKILQNTSVEGLQQSFLQRNGNLFFSDNEWQLIVEQKSYDMLLEQLPWNISMIKLPWMKNILKTQWF